MKNANKLLFKLILVIFCMKFGAGCKCTCQDVSEPDANFKQWEVVTRNLTPKIRFISTDNDTIFGITSREEYKVYGLNSITACPMSMQAMFQIAVSYYVADTLNQAHNFDGNGIVTSDIYQEISKDYLGKQECRFLPKPLSITNFTQNGKDFIDVKMYDINMHPHDHLIHRFIVKQNEGVIAIYIDNKLYEKK